MDGDAVDWSSPEFMASHALRLSSRNNYEHVTEKDVAGEEREGWICRWPPGQKKWLEEGAAKANAEQSAFTRSLAVRMAMDDDTTPAMSAFLMRKRFWTILLTPCQARTATLRMTRTTLAYAQCRRRVPRPRLARPKT